MLVFVALLSKVPFKLALNGFYSSCEILAFPGYGVDMTLLHHVQLITSLGTAFTF